MRSFFEEFLQLLGALREFYQALENKQETIIIAPISALLHPLPKKELLESFKITLLEKYNLKDLKDKLFYYGYEILDLVEVEGEASFRGDIVDIYIPNSKAYRLSFFDAECESIKELDPTTQMSLKEDLLEIEIPPTLFSLDESSYKDLKTKVEQSPLNSFSKDLTSFGLWFLGEKVQDLLSVYKSVISPRALEEIQELASLNELDDERFKFLEVMLEFAKGNYQVLLCTSIVESGIHLPNANTIIIDNAQNFGLADLHQLRGRVGRGKKEGFCYFLIEDQKSLNEQALKRLLALEKNSYLGSGESIAYHDLEIRGGGNLLGQDQSGHIKNIGYALYTRMLEDAIYELSGGKKRLEKSVEIQLGVSAFLNPELIASDSLRLDLYRRLSLCENVDEVGQIHEEIEDRFGKMDDLSAQFLQIITLKILANQLGIIKLSNFNQNITLTYSDEHKESLKAPSKDDNDILETLLKHLRAQISLKRR
ncbi:TRCF domain-containing protein [Helicobacter pylori]|uniref:TRCF domain-containing protein n=1 Tax=Helicobacter pylori TaxID=210 RepID=UPI0026B60878